MTCRCGRTIFPRYGDTDCCRTCREAHQELLDRRAVKPSLEAKPGEPWLPLAAGTRIGGMGV